MVGAMSKLNLFRSANKVTMLLIVFGRGGGGSEIMMISHDHQVLGDRKSLLVVGL